jgi:hypothetical protein
MQTGNWKVARTGRLENLPYIQSERFTDSTSEFGIIRALILQWIQSAKRFSRQVF